MPLDRSVDAILRDAIERGEFDNLSGAGKPLDLTAYFNTPEEVRLAYSILKNADVLPEEASLLNEIAALKEGLETCFDDPRCRTLRKAIEDRLLKYHLMMDRRKAR